MLCVYKSTYIQSIYLYIDIDTFHPICLKQRFGILTYYSHVIASTCCTGTVETISHVGIWSVTRCYVQRGECF